MKMFYLLVIVGLSALTGCATTVPGTARGIEINSKKIAISETAILGASPQMVKINTSNFKNGVYISLSRNILDQKYVHTTKLIEKFFTDRGVKVVDKPEDADASFLFIAAGLNEDSIESQLDHSRSINGLASAGSIGSMYVMSGGSPFVLAGGIVGMFIPIDETSSILCSIKFKPVTQKIKNELIISSGIDKEYVYSSRTKYRLQGKNEEKANDADIFEMSMGEWFNTFINTDTQIASSAK